VDVRPKFGWRRDAAAITYYEKTQVTKKEGLLSFSSSISYYLQRQAHTNGQPTCYVQPDTRKAPVTLPLTDAQERARGQELCALEANPHFDQAFDTRVGAAGIVATIVFMERSGLASNGSVLRGGYTPAGECNGTTTNFGLV